MAQRRGDLGGCLIDVLLPDAFLNDLLVAPVCCSAYMAYS